MEALSDGVFAIAITLLVMDIKIPAQVATMAGFDLGNAIVKLWPQLFAYALSFLMIGIYWANHHHLFKLFRRTDHTFNLLNVLFLMCISFVPFPTSVLGQFWTEPSQRHDAVTLYAVGMLLPAMAWFLKWSYASRKYRLLNRRLDENYVALLSRQFGLSVLLYMIAIAVSLFNSVLSLLLVIAMTLLYLRSPPKPLYRELPPASPHFPSSR